MKKFNFSLETVLGYKQQALDSQKSEHAEIIRQLQEQETLVKSLQNRYREYDLEYTEKKTQGITITEALLCQNCLRAMEDEIQQQTLIQERLRKQEEKKREEVIEARKETRSLETLREKKLDSYQKSLRREEEKFIDDLVSAARASRTTA